MKAPVLTLFVASVLLAPPAFAEGPKPIDVDALLDRVDDMWRGASSQARVAMRVKTKHYERSMRMEAWSKGEEKTLIRILSPLKEKGSATLKSGETIYTYLPKTDRTIRLTSGMMGSSWMGSHFTNDDLVKESRLRLDFAPEISFRGERDGKSVIELSLIPRPDAAVVWGKIVIVVEETSLLPLRTIYYDEDLEVARRASFHDIKDLGGRRVPSVMHMEPADEPGEFTRITYEKIDYDVKLQDSFFSVSRLKRRR